VLWEFLRCGIPEPALCAARGINQQRGIAPWSPRVASCVGRHRSSTTATLDERLKATGGRGSGDQLIQAAAHFVTHSTKVRSALSRGMSLDVTACPADQQPLPRDSKAFRQRRFCRRFGVAGGTLFLLGSVPLLAFAAVAAGHLVATLSLLQAAAFCIPPIGLACAAVVANLAALAAQRSNVPHRLAKFLIAALPFRGDRRVTEFWDSCLVFVQAAAWVAGATGPLTSLLFPPPQRGQGSMLPSAVCGPIGSLLSLLLGAAYTMQLGRLDRRALVRQATTSLEAAAAGGGNGAMMPDAVSAPVSSGSAGATTGLRQRRGASHIRVATGEEELDALDLSGDAAPASASAGTPGDRRVLHTYLGRAGLVRFLRQLTASLTYAFAMSVFSLAIFWACGGQVFAFYTALVQEAEWRYVVWHSIGAVKASIESVTHLLFGSNSPWGKG